MKSYFTYLMFNTSSLVRIAVLFAGLFLLSNQDVQATHIVGGDLTYECLGNNMYRFRLTVRRDCEFGAADAPFDNPAAIGLYDLLSGEAIVHPTFFPFGEIRIAYNSSDTLNEQLMSDCSVVDDSVCVETFVYDTILQLPFRPSGYIFVYQRCCRNQSLNNIVNPLQTGMSLVAELTGAAQAECNSSPRFGDFPPVYTCVNREIVFDHSATDLDGDSLVYELCTPLNGGTIGDAMPHSPFTGPPYENVVFRAPYSLSDVMGGVPLEIDPNTGLLTGTPNTIGQFVVGICVTAYKNGVMTGKTRRDFQFNVRMCRDVPTPAFFAPSLDCEDLTVVFDNQSLLADEYLWIFDLNHPNINSTEFEPTFTYDSGGFYNVALVVNVLEGDKKFCIDTIVHTIGVFDSQVNAEFTWDVSSCSDTIVLELTDQSNDPDPLYDIDTWQWLVTAGTSVYASSDTNPQIPLVGIDGPTTVLVVLTVISSNGCSAVQTHSFQVNQINLVIDPNSNHLCRGDSTGLLLGAPSDFTYIWSPADFLFFDPPSDFSDPIAFPDSTITYSVTVTDGLCEVDTSITVVVQQLPQLGFTFVSDCRTLEVVFDNISTGGEDFFWNFGDGNTSTENDPTHVYQDTGVYIVTLESRDGCDVSISQEVTANAISVNIPDNTINCFQDSIALNPGADENYIYEWTPIEFLSDPNSPNPNASVPDDTEFYVTIYSPGLEDCPIFDTITVIIPDAFTVSAGPDTTSCNFSGISITAVSNGDVEFVWTNSDGEILSTDATFVADAIVTDTFTVTATDSLGCSKSDEVIVSRQDSSFMVDAGRDTSYCNRQLITLIGTSSIPDVTFQWVFEGDTISDQDTLFTSPEIGPATYQLIATEIATGCQVSDIVTLNPTYFDLSITEDASICLDEELVICVDNNNPEQDLSFLWAPLGSIDSLGVGNFCAFVSPEMTTDYCVTVTNDVVGCLDTLCSQVVVNVFNPSPVTITPSDPNPVIGDVITLTVNQPANFGYVWSTTDGSTPSGSNPEVTITETPVTYTVTVTNLEGCTQVATLTIIAQDPLCNEEDIFLPNAFTPNGDGVNDVLYVLSNFISDLDLHIYNRWGEEVFSTTSQSVGWDGKFNGERLPPDVYGYYMNVGCPNNKTYFEKGNITLLE